MGAIAGRLVLIILIIIGGIFALGVGYATADQSPSLFKDNLCRVNSGVVDWLAVGKAFFPLALCNKYSIGEIDATDWSECSERYELTKDIKACATEQVANYANNCWERFGKGDEICNPAFKCSGRCYKFTIRNLANNDISQTDIRDALDDPLIEYSLKRSRLKVKGVSVLVGGREYKVKYHRDPLVEGENLFIQITEVK